MDGVSRNLDANFEKIQSWEEKWAKGLSFALIKPRPFNVWEVMVPVLLAFNYAKQRREREIYTQNFLFTKIMALKAARDSLKKGYSKEEILKRLDQETQTLLGTVAEGLYCEEVRQKQLAEMDLLLDHYGRLLAARGNDYSALVLDVYADRSAYEAFLQLLKAAEREVNLAALGSVGKEGGREMVSRMEEASDRLRMRVVVNIFGP
ncbi:MAG: NF038143 family protein [Desulfatiglandales bacterium]